jgi:LuxR family maltose regulon positive regulatory protein
VGDVHKTLASYSLIVQGEYRRARELPLCETPLKVAYQKMLTGLAWWHEGEGRRAEDTWTDALEYADEEFGVHSVTAALARAIAARLAFERGELQQAQESIDQRLAVLELSAPLEWMWAACSVLAWSHYADGRSDDAWRMLDYGCALARQRGWSRMEAALLVDQMRQADPSDLGKLAPSAERLHAIGQATRADGAGKQTMFLCEIGQGYFDGFSRVGPSGSNRITTALASLAPNASAPLRAQGALMLAQVLDYAGDRNQAAVRLVESLMIGEQLGLRQTFRTAGRGIVEALLTSDRPAPLPASAPSAAYVAALTTERGMTASSTSRAADRSGPAAHLSEREREILMLVGRGMSNKEIGRGLRIGPETVKWHLKNLFIKLDVPNRIQAVNRARALSII